MSAIDGAGRRIEALVARYFDGDVPDSRDLPRYVAPLPGWLENVGLRLAWVLVAVNALGTVFGFWYYAGRPLEAAPPLIEGQLGMTPVIAWPVVPDSPMATLFIALSFAAWRLDLRGQEYLHALAFFGCLKLGFWTPYVQLLIEGIGATPLWLYHFLVWSHLAMVAEGFLIHRYSDFPVRAVAVAVVWYTFNDVVDYFVPLVGDPHHTVLFAEYTGDGFDHSLAAHDLAAAGAVVLTILATFLALAANIEKRRA